MATIVKTAELIIGSPAFAPNELIPKQFTCDGDNINPAITIENIPEGTKTLALIVEDPDAADGIFNHWIVWNIKPREMIIENTIPGTEGKNSFGTTNYRGPCSPSGKNRYFFKVYALDSILSLRAGSEKQSLEKAMKHHILASGEIIGKYRTSGK